jgi:hypothetical protein
MDGICQSFSAPATGPSLGRQAIVSHFFWKDSFVDAPFLGIYEEERDP